jgi:hypothetical protein
MTKSLEEISNEIVIWTILEELRSPAHEDSNFHSSVRNRALQKLLDFLILRFTSIAFIHMNCSYDVAARVVDSTCLIQRVARGFFARQEARRLREDYDTKADFITKQFYAKVIQRCVRGYLSRKHGKDLRKRRIFLREILRVNECSQIKLRNAGKCNLEADIRKAVKARRAVTVFEARNQHHLLSTKSRSSVFNSEFVGPSLTEWGVPVETLIKHVQMT